MSGTALALVVVAAALHAGWNALTKRAGDQLLFLWSSMTLASVLLTPFAVWGLGAEGFPASAVPFVVATILLHALYFYALGRAYGSGDFSLVYPIARGLGVALVPLLAFPLLGERLSPLGAAGVSLVVAGIVTLHLLAHVRSAAARGLPRLGPGTWWALVTGLTIAAYSLLDKAGVGHLHPFPYIALMGYGSAVCLLPVLRGRRAALTREWRERGRMILVASTMNLTAYLLVLFAFRLSKVGYVVAARELSIVLSALIGSLWFREGPLAPRLVGSAVILAGVICVGLAR